MSTFTGNVNLLVAAPMLQDYLVDKDGTPMAAGTITCWHDNSRTTLKNWFYQTGMPGAYTYTSLPNPLTLSAAGTISDINGVDTIPFFYPFSETDETQRDPYYITIVNFKQTNQITRENFPFLGNQSGTITTENTFNNLIVNGVFWRNIQPNTVNNNPATSFNLEANMAIPQGGTNNAVIVAPSQHDGFRMPDIQFQMDVLSSAADTATFTPFPLGFGQPANNAILPEYYISHNCTNAGSGVGQKFYQFPISLHVNSLDNVEFTFSILAQNGAVSGSGIITVFILQDTGTGGGAATRKQIGSITLNSSWQLYTITSTFLSSAGLSLGQGADDGWYLQIQMPLTSVCTINFTKPSIYLTNNLVPSNDVQTYDQIGAIIDSPRIGDIRLSMNSFYPYGWVPMNNGFIGLQASGSTLVSYARANADTWPLYNLLWTLGKTYDPGSNGINNVIQMFHWNGSAFVLASYGSSAYADFTATQALQLTQTMGRALIGTVPIIQSAPFPPGSALLMGGYQQGVTSFTSTGGGSPKLIVNITNGGFLFTGMPVAFTTTGMLPSTIKPNSVYFVTAINSSAFELASTYVLAIAGTPDIAFNGSATGNATVNMNITSVPINNSPSSVGSAINQGSAYSNFFIKL